MNKITPAAPDLTSPRAILDRAKKHQDDYAKLTGGALWAIDLRQDRATGEWVYSLGCNYKRLITAKPILADCATNIASALDNVIGAMARANDKSRGRLYFPSQLADQDFQDALTHIKPEIGDKMAGVIEEHRVSQRPFLEFIKAAKEISNTTKHWELLASNPFAHGIALNQPNGEQKIYQIPTDAFQCSDTFEFYRGNGKLSNDPMSVATSLKISGLTEELPNSPDFILSNSISFVESIINAVAKVS